MIHSSHFTCVLDTNVIYLLLLNLSRKKAEQVPAFQKKLNDKLSIKDNSFCLPNLRFLGSIPHTTPHTAKLIKHKSLQTNDLQALFEVGSGFEPPYEVLQTSA